MRIAINGAGVGGPTLAWWLLEYGHEPVLIEQAPKLRSGGYVIDFWGLGYDIAEKMGLIERLRELGYQVEEVRFVDGAGRKAGGFGTEVFSRMTNGRFTSLRRSDVSATVCAAMQGRLETVFGDSIAAIEEHGDGVRIGFDHGAERDFDLVVGADGLHSRVRRLAFGPQDEFEKFLGYRVAAFEAEGYRPRDELVYVSHAEPGRQVARFSMRDDTTLFLFVFHEEEAGGALPADDFGPQGGAEIGVRQHRLGVPANPGSHGPGGRDLFRPCQPDPHAATGARVGWRCSATRPPAYRCWPAKAPDWP